LGFGKAGAPRWAHHIDNIGSMKTALALGFQREKECRVISVRNRF
jgi:hypothetical protein